MVLKTRSDISTLFSTLGESGMFEKVPTTYVIVDRLFLYF